MRNCRVCGCEFEDGLGNCPSCNFAYIAALSEDQEAQIGELAVFHRAELLRGTQVGIILWKPGDSDALQRTEKRFAAGAPGEIAWLEEPIAGLSAPSVEVELYAERRKHTGETTRREIRTQVTLRSEAGEWHIGAERTKDGFIRVCMKAGGEIVRSAPINVL